MEKKTELEISKKLSYVLRHKPEAIDIQLDEEGWTDVSILISKLEITIEDLRYVVANNAKQRFALDEQGQRIRANQGHSVDINLGLKAENPPPQLYHGTSTKSFDSIIKEGIKKGERNHVHLSSDHNTATKVGMRHGKPVVLIIDTVAMSEDGCEFYKSDNGVWLTEYVKPEYIKPIE